MRLKTGYILLIAAVAIALFSASCQKTQRIQAVGGGITFSDDTLSFDTVFTAAGSFTTGLLIYNPQSQPIILSSVRLAHGTSSYFHLNVDGFAGNDISNLKIQPHDSIYVFATVKIDPNDHRTPFVVTDSLIANLNGKDYYVPFTAYGQNAHYIVDSVLTGNITWDTTLPYVIINTQWRDAQGYPTPGGAFIRAGSTLTLSAGCRIYMHQNASLIVFGTLLSKGTNKDSVIFQGDRLDRRYFGYEGYPGEWASLYFYSRSNGSKLEYTRIQNGGNGYGLGTATTIYLDIDSNAAGSQPQLQMENCVIQNSIGTGIHAHKASLTVSNSLINTTGGYALAMIQGGRGTFTNCTFANYGGTGLSHSNQGTVAILNFWRKSQNEIFYGDLNATMHNCIVYGSLDSEIVCSADLSQAAANLELDHCLLKMGSVREPFVHFAYCIFNQDPLFKDTNKKDFHLKDNSPAINNSNPDFDTGVDLDGVTRSNKTIGCYDH
jgi:hypothetical protein